MTRENIISERRIIHLMNKQRALAVTAWRQLCACKKLNRCVDFNVVPTDYDRSLHLIFKGRPISQRAFQPLVTQDVGVKVRNGTGPKSVLHMFNWGI